MAYHMRVVCPGKHPDALSVACAWVQRQGVALAVGAGTLPTMAHSVEWTAGELDYAPGLPPLPIFCIRAEEQPAAFAAELQSLREAMGTPRFSPARWVALAKLRQVRFVVSCQVPTANPLARRAAETFLGYFVQHCHGTLHVGHESFATQRRLPKAG